MLSSGHAEGQGCEHGLSIYTGWDAGKAPGSVPWEALEAATTQEHTQYPDLGF